MKILIAYASAKGSTQSIAERINTRISAANIGDVTTQPIDKNIPLDDFTVLIIGSCIHVQSWLKPASGFVKSKAAYLKQHPKKIWAFSVGMPPVGGERGEEEKMEKWLKKSMDIRGHRLFQGMWQQKDMSWCFRWLFGCFGGKFEDRRDWDAIDSWADEIVLDLRMNPPAQEHSNEGI
jgi:menaquinone-dependent protoporphyrinogen oxidase